MARYTQLCAVHDMARYTQLCAVHDMARYTQLCAVHDQGSKDGERLFLTAVTEDAANTQR